MARPSSYSEELLDEISSRLATGEPLAVICRDDGMPTDRTVRNWMTSDTEVSSAEEVSSAIACARELGFDAIAHSARLTARKQGDSTDDVQRDKLIIETDLKLLAKWDPKRYGDTAKLKHVGGDEDDAPIQTEGRTTLDIAGLNHEQLRALASIKIPAG